jgi:hypothetical protein
VVRLGFICLSVSVLALLLALLARGFSFVNGGGSDSDTPSAESDAIRTVHMKLEHAQRDVDIAEGLLIAATSKARAAQERFAFEAKDLNVIQLQCTNAREQYQLAVNQRRALEAARDAELSYIEQQSGFLAAINAPPLSPTMNMDVIHALQDEYRKQLEADQSCRRAEEETAARIDKVNAAKSDAEAAAQDLQKAEAEVQQARLKRKLLEEGRGG